jgi:carbonic anhydrase
MINKILEIIIEGNRAFSASKDKEYFEKIKQSQNPKITLLTCSDSRVQTSIFGVDTINEVFVVRNIGNQIISAFGSIDFGIIHLKTPLLIILGHTHCGAIKAVFSNYEKEPFDIIRELDHLSIPIRHLKHDGNDFETNWLTITELSVDYQVKLALKKYHLLVKNQELTIIGAINDFINIYKSGEGRLIITNLNGEKNPDKILENPLLANYDKKLLKEIIKRSK